ncbi:hypothetical protein PoB_005060000 [Plakobranchus ocellatus]|uniref:Uncharacterized protein n=1 Tax=Plakobranchus ocellatus TaxID=259542 RepID=A0AAV4BXP4_9GAST|nr:hypothetical protein PoB_005060000 [Plakobranchus ocellatus]
MGFVSTQNSTRVSKNGYHLVRVFSNATRMFQINMIYYLVQHRTANAPRVIHCRCGRFGGITDSELARNPAGTFAFLPLACLWCLWVEKVRNEQVVKKLHVKKRKLHQEELSG